MERYAILEEKYGQAARKLAEARSLLEPTDDPEVAHLNGRITEVNKTLDEMQREVAAICNEFGRLAARSG